MSRAVIGLVAALALIGSTAWPGAAQTAKSVNEQVVYEVAAQLRCVVCQNQSIDDSNAPLARDLRVLLRERLKAGDTDHAAIDYIAARYGNFVLLKPPVQVNTLLLWFGPAIIFILALLAYWMLIRKRPEKSADAAPETLTAAEREELRSILKESPTP